MKLYEFLKKKRITSEIARTMVIKLQNIEEYVKTLDRVVTIYHPFYTLHDFTHVENVIKCLDSFKLGKVIKRQPLNEFEIFTLLTATLLHDVGMIEIEDGDNLEIADQEKLGEVIRQSHHERSYNHIQRNKERLNLDDYEAHIIGLVAKGHRKINIINDKDFTPIPAPNAVPEIIRLDLLAALLRIADELDLSFSRAPRIEEDYIKNLPGYDYLTQLHWLKHYYTIGHSTKIVETSDNFVKLVIDFTFRIPCREYEHFFIFPYIIHPIRKKLEYLELIFLKNGFSIEIGEIDYRIIKGLTTIQEKSFLALQTIILNEYKPRVLIIDDDQLVRKDLIKIIQEFGFPYECATNCKEGDKKLIESKFNIIILDLRMLDYSNRMSDFAGIDFLDNLGFDVEKYIILVFTGLQQKSEAELSDLIVKCIRNGALDFIKKVSSKNSIKKRLSKLISENLKRIIENP
jgi:FixJ family two-component response regulator